MKSLWAIRQSINLAFVHTEDMEKSQEGEYLIRFWLLDSVFTSNSFCQDIVNSLRDHIDGYKHEPHEDGHSDGSDASDGSELNDQFEDALTLQNEDEVETLTEEEIAERKLKSDSLKADGNTAYKSADYEKAVQLYTEALDICPKSLKEERSVLYSNRSAANLQQDLKDQAITDCTESLKLNDTYLKPLIRRAKLHEDTDKLDESLADYQRILEIDPGYAEARSIIPRLNVKIEQRNEKMKEEMLGKLKDLGNMILRPFGLSTRNFQMQQDPGTGSYSVNFNQNPDAQWYL